MNGAGDGPRVVIATAAVGCGHTRAALALREGVLAARPGARVEFVEALDHAAGWFVRPYRDGYLSVIGRFPALAGWVYSATDKRGGGGLGRMVERRGLSRFCASKSLAGADLVLTTHFLCGRVLGAMRTAGTLKAPLGVCVTDVHPHAVWLAEGIDLLMVAGESSRAAAVRQGFAAERVAVTGIPIDLRFSELPEKRAAREELGLPPVHRAASDPTEDPRGRPMVLVAGGGLGLGGIEGVVRRLMACGRGVHVSVICGRNAALKQALAPLVRDWRSAGPGEVSCSVEGFTTQMPAFMAAADVLVGKPGGLSTAEACASGLPMVLLRPIPGQEERNAAFLCGCGAAVMSGGDEQAAGAAVALAFDGVKRAGMGRASAAVGKSGAAREAAAAALGLVRAGVDRSAGMWEGTDEGVLLGLPCVAS